MDLEGKEKWEGTKGNDYHLKAFHNPSCFHAMKRIRADELLTAGGLCESRTQAKAVIMAGKVWMGSERIDKPSRMLPENSELKIEKPPPFVSRGGQKLEAFLEKFEIVVKNLEILDLGSSTGGFTDCLLQFGAKGVTCVDVGRGQLHGTLRNDERIDLREGFNVRYLETKDLPRPFYDLVVMDLSFISLRKTLEKAWSFLRPGGKLIALIKPQFEAKKEEADAGKGIIRDPWIHRRVVREIREFVEGNLAHAQLFGSMESPLKGTAGNTEFLLGWKKSADSD